MTWHEQEGVLRSQGRRIGWMVRGPRDGRLVGWFHGQPGSRRDINAFSPEVLERFGVRLFSVDRAGYGDTDPAGLDRRDVARDLLAVADHLEGAQRFAVMAVSMGGVYALTLAAEASDRVERVVLISGHVLPYDDPDVIARLSEAERDDVASLLGGRTPELEAQYAASAAEVASDPSGLIRQLAEGWSPQERSLISTPWLDHVAASLAFGLGPGHVGLLEDGLRTVRPLEIDLAQVRCPVRIIHGEIDDLEPYANVQRLLPQLSDATLMALPGMGHFGPWLWPDIIMGMLTGY